jgi:hypothetical protein
MARVFTSEQLITEVRRIGAFSDVASEGKTDTDILNALNTVMLDEMLPSLIKYREEYLVKAVNQTVTTSDEFIQIPSRAIGNTLRDVFFRSADFSSNTYLPKINREDIPFITSLDTTNSPSGFYLEGDSLRLLPGPVAGVLRLSYFFRPGALVLSDSYRTVSSVDSSTSVTLDSAVPTAWTTATLFDVHSKTSGAENRYFDKAASTVSGTTLTFSTAIDGSLTDTQAIVAGDYVVEAENAAVPALPREMHPILAQAATARLLESEGDTEMLNVARQTLARQLQNMNQILEARVEGKPIKVTNRHSFVNRQTFRGAW